MNFLLYIVQLYEIILLVRFLSSFFVTSRWLYHPLYQGLYIMTEPYLKLFRFRILTWHSWDFSPILAIWFLGLIKAIFVGIINSVSSLLIYLLMGIWDLSYLVGVILLILLGFRLISSYFFHQSYPSLTYNALDGLLSRISFGICRIFLRRGFMSYNQSLALSFILILLMGCILNFVVRLGIFWLSFIPF